MIYVLLRNRNKRLLIKPQFKLGFKSVYDLYTKKCQKRGREVGEGKKAKGSRAVRMEGAGGQSPQDSSPLVIIILTDFF